MAENKFEYMITMIVPGDGIAMKVTGIDVEFEKLNDKARIRPRHIRIIHEVQLYMKEIIKSYDS